MSMMKKISLFLITFGIVFFLLSFYSIYKVNSQVISNIDKVHSNSYVGKYDISDVELDNISTKLSEIENDIIENNNIKLIINGKEYVYKISELGVRIDKDSIINDVSNYEESLDYWTLYNSYSKNNFEKVTYSYKYIVNSKVLKNFLLKLKKDVDVKPQAGK